MTSRPHPPTKSTPSAPAPLSLAEPTLTPSRVGAPKGVARRASVHALRPDPQNITVTGIQRGLTVRGLDRGEIPVADWLCLCGHHEHARGRAAVAALNGRARVGHCPHNAPAVERRTAA
ncbi:hypothetical protein HEK616_01850 [Streptomyces nigrescens]|uniref:Uncharacterized protein n=1 Tax=Streptomyces nigrescens TaxID=1920 RepID=A0ABM7ZJX9_STRNI|nr:hypothetical protein HEK616_01850 [Streptomyces nigrescens]